LQHRKLSQHWQAKSIRRGGAPALPHQIMAIARRIFEPAHCLDYAKDRHFSLGKHGRAATHIRQRDFLGRGDDQRRRYGHALGYRQLCIPRSRRRVDDQHVQRIIHGTPFRIIQHLCDC